MEYKLKKKYAYIGKKLKIGRYALICAKNF